MADKSATDKNAPEVKPVKFRPAEPVKTIQGADGKSGINNGPKGSGQNIHGIHV